MLVLQSFISLDKSYNFRPGLNYINNSNIYQTKVVDEVNNTSQNYINVELYSL